MNSQQLILNQSSLLRLSQSQLQLLETCPRKFQNTYLEQLASPSNIEQQERMNWGSRFHLLMQQRELGLPVNSLIEEDAQMQQLISALVAVAPELQPKLDSFRDPEHCRTLSLEGYLLTVIYDLLIEEEIQAQILDWKTYPKPKNRQKIEDHWQTKLYLYVLAETSNYLPEQLSMTYWFVQSQPEPQKLTFTYDTAKHEQNKQDLSELLSQLTWWLQRYQEGISFPQVPATKGHCDRCDFDLHCQRIGKTEESYSTSITDIQEVSI